MNAAILLGLCSALSWGSGDFLGGLVSRRLSSQIVVFWSQCAGGLLILSVALLTHARFTTPGLLWGAAAGLCGAVGLVLFYRGLAVGVVAIVAPISACGAVVPIAVSAVLGYVPSTLVLTGVGVAFVGIICASIAVPSHSASQISLASLPWHTRIVRMGVPFGLGAALAFGGFLAFAARGAVVSGASPLWIIFGARCASVTGVGLLLIRNRELRLVPRSLVPGVVGAGIFDTTANTLYSFAATLGNLAVVSVLGSLYPVTTVVLALIVLRERLSGLQLGGILLALVGVALMASG